MIVGNEVSGIPTVQWVEIPTDQGNMAFLPGTYMEINCHNCGKTFSLIPVLYLDTGEDYVYHNSIARRLKLFYLEDVCPHHKKYSTSYFMFIVREDQEFFKDKLFSLDEQFVGPEDRIE